MITRCILVFPSWLVVPNSPFNSLSVDSLIWKANVLFHRQTNFVNLFIRLVVVVKCGGHYLVFMHLLFADPMPTSSSSSNDKNAPGSSSSMANNNSISNSGTCGAVLRDSNNGNGSGTASSSNNTNTGSALTSGGFVGATRSGNSIVGSNGGNIINIDNTNTGNNTSRSTNSPSSHYWGNGAFIVQHKFTRAKSYYIDDEGRPKADPKQLRWSASDPEVRS